MRILFAGTPAVAVPTLTALLAAGHDIVAVVSQPSAAAGRGRQLKDSEIAQYAKEHNLRLFTPDSINSDEALTDLRSLSPDLAVVVAYGQILREPALAVPAHGWVNLHFSLLPAWRGAAPVAHALMAGDEVVGASTFKLESGMDTGPVYGQLTLDVRPTETAGELLDRLAIAGADLMVATVSAIADGSARAQPQANQDATFAPKLITADAEVNWMHPALAIDRMIRGCTPEPGAWTTCQGDRLGMGPVVLRPDVDSLAPAELSITKKSVLVGTGSVPVELGEVKPAGKNWMAAADWARGLRGEVRNFNA